LRAACLRGTSSAASGFKPKSFYPDERLLKRAENGTAFIQAEAAPG